MHLKNKTQATFTVLTDKIVEIISSKQLDHLKGGTIRDGDGGDVEKD